MVGRGAAGHGGGVTGWDEVVDGLYGGPLDDFVVRRDAAVRGVKAAGDKDLARRVGALRKPTVAAWAVNLLVRDDPALAGALRDLGDGMREAERSLDGPALRELGAQRRALVAGLVTRARRLAVGAGQGLSTAAAQEVERTLTAALADPRVADAVAAGTLTHGTEYVGFGMGTYERVGLPSEPDGNPTRSEGKGETGEYRPRRAREGERRAGENERRAQGDDRHAREDERRAQGDERRAREDERRRQRHADAVAARRAAQAELDRLRARHDDAVTTQQAAARALHDAEQASADAYAAQDELVQALADVRRRLAEARAALPRADEALVAARTRARDQEKAVRAARRDLDRAQAAADRARAQEDATADGP